MNKSKIISKLINYYVHDIEFNTLANLVIKETLTTKNDCFCEKNKFTKIMSTYLDLDICFDKLDSFLGGIAGDRYFEYNIDFYEAGEFSKEICDLKKI